MFEITARSRNYKWELFSHGSNMNLLSTALVQTETSKASSVSQDEKYKNIRNVKYEMKGLRFCVGMCN